MLSLLGTKKSHQRNVPWQSPHPVILGPQLFSELASMPRSEDDVNPVRRPFGSGDPSLFRLLGPSKASPSPRGAGALLVFQMALEMWADEGASAHITLQDPDARDSS